VTGHSGQSRLRIGLDLGGSKIEGILLSPEATEMARYCIATPRDDYAATIAAIVDLTRRLMQDITAEATIGIAVPGSISPQTGLMQNANSTWLNERPFDRDLATALVRPVRLANDANCFALSEAIDGAAENARTVFGVILGTGCGGGLVVNRRVLDGPRGIGGEWGHNPLALDDARRIPRTFLLVWTQRVPGKMGFGSRYGCRSFQSDGGDTHRRGDRRPRQGWK
jgi:fructokinase